LENEPGHDGSRRSAERRKGKKEMKSGVKKDMSSTPTSRTKGSTRLMLPKNQGNVPIQTRGEEWGISFQLLREVKPGWDNSYKTNGTGQKKRGPEELNTGKKQGKGAMPEEEECPQED